MDEQQRRDAMETLALRDPEETGRWDAGAVEAYQLSWPGKAAMLAALRSPAAAVLKPCPEASLEAARMPHGVIEGDNLPVLKRLRKRYLKRVKMIYIDPPYNTGGDFLYEDNFRARRGDGPGAADDEGRRHGPWLNMIYPRLVLARELLRDDGVLFVSIDDHEVHTLRLVLDEIFGAANFVAMFAWQSRTSRQNDTDLCVQPAYVVAYARRRRQAQRRLSAA
ncbi:MAG: site-specific DNA-methyltransferase, partial [Alcanivorax sp.]|nr:site-specific DNA-methyltransferase [Alcanivorax sp.]